MLLTDLILNYECVYTIQFICISTCTSFKKTFFQNSSLFLGSCTDFRIGYTNFGTVLACSNFCRTKSYGSLVAIDHETPTGIYRFHHAGYTKLALLVSSNVTHHFSILIFKLGPAILDSRVI